MMIRSIIAGCVGLLAVQAGAQMVAGEIPVGYTLTTHSIHLEPISDYTEASALIDIDCDGEDDFKILLRRWNPSMDIANRLYLKPLVDSITVCANIIGPLCPSNHAYLYSEGQPMSCPLPFTMLVDSSTVIGDYVSFTCGGIAPQSADSMYIHFAKVVNGVTNEGWILLSFDILSSSPGPLDPPGPGINPWADVHASIGICQGTGIYPQELNETRIKLFPNPALKGLVHWTSPMPILSVEAHDVMGRLVLVGAGGRGGQLDLSGRRGTFFITFTTADGPLPPEKLVVY